MAAKRGRPRRQWHYAASRATHFELNFSRNGRREAEYPRLEAWPSDGAYFHLPVEMPDYPFKPIVGKAKAGGP